MDTSALKRVTVFAGHYGSGKTNVAINYALAAAQSGKKTAIADLDIVNPYFRTADSQKMLADQGVKLISSPYANTNVDVPALPAEAYSVIYNKDVYAIIDVGGDDRGALALGRYAPEIIRENNYEMFFVINKYRFLTDTADATLQVLREIESVTELKFTGIVNNSNLGADTTAVDVLNSLEYAAEVAQLSGLSIKMTTVYEKIAHELQGKVPGIMPIKLYVRQSWLR